MSSAARAPLSRPEVRCLVALFVGAWIINFGFSLVGWDNTLLNRFEFRQVQTAITAAHLPPGRLPLAYETPIFGPPWSVPLEFPVFQSTVATISAVTGMALDPAGRLVSWIYFQLSLPAFFLLLGFLGLPRPLRLIGLSLVLTSPIYLFFSRAFLIESAVLCFCAWFLAAFVRWTETGRRRWLVVALLAGSLGATVKATTMVVFGVAAVLFVAARGRRATPGPARRVLLLRAAAAFSLPFVLGLAWAAYSKQVRAHNPEAGFLDDIFGYWSFGDLPQRLSARYWFRTVYVWTDGLVTEAGLALGLCLAARPPAPYRTLAVAAFAVFLSAQLIFSNLYEVHDYYFYGSGVFLILALGLLLAGFFTDTGVPLWGRVAVPVLIVALQLFHYSRHYLPEQRQNDAPTELMQALGALTRPDDLVILFGSDWNAAIPYYAGRRALMFRNSREDDPAAVRRTLERLDPDRVGAVVIIGRHRADSDFVARTMAHLKLGATPVLLNNATQTGVWFPQARESGVRDRMPLHPYATLDVVPERPWAGRLVTIRFPQIMRRREFARFSPWPAQATVANGFTTSEVGAETVFNAAPPAEIVFHPRAGVRSITAGFGILDPAYTGRDRTDGVEFVVTSRQPGQPDRVIFHRLLDPARVAADQGRQDVEIPLPAGPLGDLVFRTLPGPAGNESYDWAYWGQIRIR